MYSGGSIFLDDPNDAFWLAQTFFMTHQYSRAERLLTRPFSTGPPKPNPPGPSLANGYENGDLSQMANTTANAKGKHKEVPSAMSAPRLPMGPGGMIDVPYDMQESVSRLVDMSVACRYLAAQCQVRQGNWTEATEMLGEANPFRNSGMFSQVVYLFSELTRFRSQWTCYTEC